MAVTTRMFAQGLVSISLAEVDWFYGNIYGMLVTSAYVPNTDMHIHRSEVEAVPNAEAVGTGYDPGGKLVPGRGLNYDAGTNTLTWSASNLTWPSLSVTFRYLIVYAQLAEKDDPLLYLVDFGADIVLEDQPFTVQFVDGAVAQWTTP